MFTITLLDSSFCTNPSACIIVEQGSFPTILTPAWSYSGLFLEKNWIPKNYQLFNCGSWCLKYKQPKIFSVIILLPGSTKISMAFNQNSFPWLCFVNLYYQLIHLNVIPQLQVGLRCCWPNLFNYRKNHISPDNIRLHRVKNPRHDYWVLSDPFLIQ